LRLIKMTGMECVQMLIRSHLLPDLRDLGTDDESLEH